MYIAQRTILRPFELLHLLLCKIECDHKIYYFNLLTTTDQLKNTHRRYICNGNRLWGVFKTNKHIQKQIRIYKNQWTKFISVSMMILHRMYNNNNDKMSIIKIQSVHCTVMYINRNFIIQFVRKTL